jgi:hypothetical protein
VENGSRGSEYRHDATAGRAFPITEEKIWLKTRSNGANMSSFEWREGHRIGSSSRIAMEGWLSVDGKWNWRRLA